MWSNRFRRRGRGAADGHGCARLGPESGGLSGGGGVDLGEGTWVSAPSASRFSVIRLGWLAPAITVYTLGWTSHALRISSAGHSLVPLRSTSPDALDVRQSRLEVRCLPAAGVGSYAVLSIGTSTAVVRAADEQGQKPAVLGDRLLARPRQGRSRRNRRRCGAPGHRWVRRRRRRQLSDSTRSAHHTRGPVRASWGSAAPGLPASGLVRSGRRLRHPGIAGPAQGLRASILIWRSGQGSSRVAASLAGATTRYASRTIEAISPQSMSGTSR